MTAAMHMTRSTPDAAVTTPILLLPSILKTAADPTTEAL